MKMGTPVRFPFGVTNNVKANPLGMMGLPDPTKYHTFFDDFDKYTAADWTITTTEGGSGDATEAVADANNGILVITNDGADNDCDWFQKVGETFLLASGKKLFFKSRFKVSDATQSDWIMGLQVTDTTPLDTGGDGVTDGIFFQKDDGDTNIDFYVQKDASGGQLTNTAVTTAAADDTFMTLGFYFDGARYVDVYKDDVLVYVADLTATLSTYLPNTELTISFGIQNGAAAAKVLSIDYIFVAQER
jgi:hypothetical protein